MKILTIKKPYQGGATAIEDLEYVEIIEGKTYAPEWTVTTRRFILGDEETGSAQGYHNWISELENQSKRRNFEGIYLYEIKSINQEISNGSMGETIWRVCTYVRYAWIKPKVDIFQSTKKEDNSSLA